MPKKGEFTRKQVAKPPKAVAKPAAFAWNTATHGARLLDAIEQGKALGEALDAGGETFDVEGQGPTLKRLPWTTVQRWIATDPGFAAAYGAARELAAAEHERRAQMEADAAIPESVGVSKLRIDLAKWRAKVANPKQYGDKVDLTSAGEKMPAAQVNTMIINGVEVTF